MTQDPTLYLANPDVSCREEGADGALLYNPDSDQVLVVNATGYLIWRALGKPHSRDQVVASLREQCNNVPEGQLPQDVSEFLEQLIAKGFVGVYGGVVA